MSRRSKGTGHPGKGRPKERRARRPVRTGRPRSSDRRPGFTRDQLLKAAAGVFAERGFENASLQLIASRAGVTSATVYRHFEHKADLLLHAVGQQLLATPIAKRLEGAEEFTAQDFARMVSAYADPGLGSLRRLAVEIHAAASRHAEAGTLLKQLNELVHLDLSRKLRDCLEAGHLPESLDTERASSLLVVLVMGLAHLETLAPQLVGDPEWIHYLESSVEELLARGEL